MHYNLDKDAAFCHTRISAETKGLKTTYHNKDEEFITRGYRNWRQATENLIVHEEYDYHKDYVNQLFPPETVYVDESFDETLICKKARNRQIFLTILRNMQFLSRQVFRENNNEGNFEQVMKLSIGFYEKLSEAVGRFPCLYGKTNKLFKDKNANWNAWAKVAEELSLETGMLLKLS